MFLTCDAAGSSCSRNEYDRTALHLSVVSKTTEAAPRPIVDAGRVDVYETQ